MSEAVNESDEWPAIRERIVAADILVMATPTWLGSTGKAAAQNLLAVARALEAHPVPPPP